MKRIASFFLPFLAVLGLSVPAIAAKNFGGSVPELVEEYDLVADKTQWAGFEVPEFTLYIEWFQDGEGEELVPVVEIAVDLNAKTFATDPSAAAKKDSIVTVDQLIKAVSKIETGTNRDISVERVVDTATIWEYFFDAKFDGDRLTKVSNLVVPCFKRKVGGGITQWRLVEGELETAGIIDGGTLWLKADAASEKKTPFALVPKKKTEE